MGVGGGAGELVKETVPGFAVVVPSAKSFDAEQSGFAESALECGVVGDLLHSFGQNVDVAVGHDEALFAVGEEVFGTGGGGGEDGAATGHGLALNESETFLDAGQHEQMAGAHFFGELRLRERTGEDDVAGGQRGKQGAHVVVDCAGDGEAFVWVAQAGEGLKKIRDAFAKADLAGEENFEGVLRWFFRAGEVIETDAVGDDVNFFRRYAHLDKRSLRDG